MIRLFEVGIFIVSVWFMVTQIILPGIKNLPWFPIFRKTNRLETEISELDEKLKEAELSDIISSKKKSINMKRESLI